MIDRDPRRAVLFPDDGHPDLCAYAVDVEGEDEVILWDQEPVWIYTQDRPFTGERMYGLARNPVITTPTIAPVFHPRAGLTHTATWTAVACNSKH